MTRVTDEQTQMIEDCLNSFDKLKKGEPEFINDLQAKEHLSITQKFYLKEIWERVT